jgi:hypothetical protein
MNLNEECLLHFLKNPNGLDKTLEQLKMYLFLKDKTRKEKLEIIIKNV